MSAQRKPATRRRDPVRKAVGAERATEDDVLKKGSPKNAGGKKEEKEGGKGPMALVRLLGPGLVTGASDDDPTNIGVYSQVGSQFGFALLWIFLFTLPFMMAIQELSARIALHTGVGLGKALKKKFPNILVIVAIAALIIANVITIGADLRATAAGFALLTHDHIRALWFVFPIAAALLAMQFFLTYERFEGLLKWLTLILLAYVVEAVILHPSIIRVVTSTVIPNLQLSNAYITAIVAVFGTTLSPYIYFWQASSEVQKKREKGENREEKRKGVSGEDLSRRRADVFIGMVVAQAVMYFLMLSTAIALHDHGKKNISTAMDAAQSLAPVAGQFAFVIFAIALIGTGLLAVPVLTASSAYVLGELFGIPGTLGTRPKYRPTFYAIIATAMVFGALMDLTPIDPIKALFIASVISGVIAGPLIILMNLLGGDRKLMGEHTSRWLSKTLGWVAAVLMLGCGIDVVVNAVHG